MVIRKEDMFIYQKNKDEYNAMHWLGVFLYFLFTKIEDGLKNTIDWFNKNYNIARK
jgi:hypothetical protein